MSRIKALRNYSARPNSRCHLAAIQIASNDGAMFVPPAMAIFSGSKSAVAHEIPFAIYARPVAGCSGP